MLGQSRRADLLEAWSPVLLQYVWPGHGRAELSPLLQVQSVPKVTADTAPASLLDSLPFNLKTSQTLLWDILRFFLFVINFSRPMLC